MLPVLFIGYLANPQCGVEDLILFFFNVYSLGLGLLTPDGVQQRLQTVYVGESKGVYPRSVLNCTINNWLLTPESMVHLLTYGIWRGPAVEGSHQNHPPTTPKHPQPFCYTNPFLSYECDPPSTSKQTSSNILQQFSPSSPLSPFLMPSPVPLGGAINTSQQQQPSLPSSLFVLPSQQRPLGCVVNAAPPVMPRQPLGDITNTAQHPTTSPSCFFPPSQSQLASMLDDIDIDIDEFLSGYT